MSLKILKFLFILLFKGLYFLILKIYHFQIFSNNFTSPLGSKNNDYKCLKSIFGIKIIRFIFKRINFFNTILKSLLYLDTNKF